MIVIHVVALATDRHAIISGPREQQRTTCERRRENVRDLAAHVIGGIVTIASTDSMRLLGGEAHGRRQSILKQAVR